MKKINLFKIVILSLIIIFMINADDTSSLKLNFALGANKKTNNKNNLIPIDENTSLKENDGIRIFFQPAESCYVYVLLYDTDRVMTLLFPEDINNYNNSGASKGVKYFLPGPSNWYHLDNNTGTETIYFIASKKRITDFEKNIAKLDNKDLNVIKKTSDDIRDNIRTMVSGQLAQTYNLQEKNPIQIAGVIRGIKNEIEKYTKGLINKDLIIKTIRFKHESK